MWVVWAQTTGAATVGRLIEMHTSFPVRLVRSAMGHSGGSALARDRRCVGAVLHLVDVGRPRGGAATVRTQHDPLVR